MGEYVTLDKTYYSPLFKQEAVAAHSYFHIFILIEFLEGAFIIHVILIIIILCINYTIVKVKKKGKVFPLQGRCGPEGG